MRKTYLISPPQNESICTIASIYIADMLLRGVQIEMNTIDKNIFVITQEKKALDPANTGLSTSRIMKSSYANTYDMGESNAGTLNFNL